MGASAPDQDELPLSAQRARVAATLLGEMIDRRTTIEVNVVDAQRLRATFLRYAELDDVIRRITSIHSVRECAVVTCVACDIVAGLQPLCEQATLPAERLRT